ncbi:hypothetical protein Xmau_00176 [Xenorhabdus mauleonii]|uniref:Uncharacterized protein n=1 Tax=Xenorhabdus mauleonii TaxID=351675 RepID=A0A1I3N423_9GAMM|nr:hypothetical protein [Xenorhabdus mauleonii]PHM45788.1 hypothetical protein Xmau_00176 [Xenorhabdus mauleonii]SFJ03981.1 hypothetical protein SAMN05421680_10584 [Xenorhabdus mauleonii]
MTQLATASDTDNLAKNDGFWKSIEDIVSGLDLIIDGGLGIWSAKNPGNESIQSKAKLGISITDALKEAAIKVLEQQKQENP